MQEQIEEWRTVPGLPGYRVSSLGRVVSYRRGAPQELAGWTDDGGYQRVAGRLRHALVAEAFLGPRPASFEVRHLDGDKTNNAVSNLRYGTKSENELDKRRHGTHHNAIKTHCPQMHAYTPENTHIRPGNKRRCLTCHREQKRAASARQRA